MIPTMRLRPATPDDLDLLRRWDAAPHIIASKGTEDWGWEQELVRSPDWREQLIAEVQGSPIGFIQIIDPAREDSHYWGDCPTGLRAIDIWIGEEAFLGRGACHSARRIRAKENRSKRRSAAGQLFQTRRATKNV